ARNCDTDHSARLMFPQAASDFIHRHATTEIPPLSLHDALPIWGELRATEAQRVAPGGAGEREPVERGTPARLGGRRVVTRRGARDRKSTRLNSSHEKISYAVFCLKKKNHHPHQLTKAAAAPTMR